MKEKQYQQKRKRWFRCLKSILKIGYKKVNFEYLGEKPTNGSIILSNHVGSLAPMTMELYADFPVRFWGTHEANSGLKKLYRYQTKIYYHEKKHWNLFLARLACLIISPLTNMVYKGLKVISTYQDSRLRNTIKESVDLIKNKGENIVIFPEDSSHGYFDKLKSFFSGFVILAQELLKNNFDVKIFTAYLNNKKRKYTFSKPLFFSELASKFSNRDEIASYLLNQCNQLNV